MRGCPWIPCNRGRKEGRFGIDRRQPLPNQSIVPVAGLADTSHAASLWPGSRFVKDGTSANRDLRKLAPVFLILLKSLSSLTYLGYNPPLALKDRACFENTDDASCRPSYHVTQRGPARDNISGTSARKFMALLRQKLRWSRLRQQGSGAPSDAKELTPGQACREDRHAGKLLRVFRRLRT